MRLLAHLEEFSKREKHTEQGVEGETFKLTKESPIPETKFEKVVKVDIGEFGYEGLVNDVLARAIIAHVNKAFRAYGYKTDLLPISHESEYEFVKDYSRGRQSVSDYNYKLSTSAFNKAADNPYDIKPLLNIIGTKALFLNYLINNGDMHWNNFVKQKKTKQHYAIDFGLAFTGEGRSDASHVDLTALKDDKKQVIDSEHKLERYAKYINFWNMYLLHNGTYLLDLFKNLRLKKNIEMLTVAILGVLEQIKPSQLVFLVRRSYRLLTFNKLNRQAGLLRS